MFFYNLHMLHIDPTSPQEKNTWWYRAGGSARVAKVLVFASFGLQILELSIMLTCHVMCSLHSVFLCCVLCIMLIIIIHNAALYQLRVWFGVWS